MAYMIVIVRASQEYEGSAWAAYDAAYRRQAAAQGKTGWSQINPSLYAICFTGKAKMSERCDRCLSASHRTGDCSLASEDDPDVSKRLKAIESAVLAITWPSPMGKQRKPRERSTDTCRNWNRNRCSFPGCGYIHQCTNYRGAPTAQHWSALLRVLTQPPWPRTAALIRDPLYTTAWSSASRPRAPLTYVLYPIYLLVYHTYQVLFVLPLLLLNTSDIIGSVLE